MKANKKTAQCYSQWKKKIQHKAFLFKAKIFLTLILPAVLILLAVKTAKVWLHLKLRDIAVSSERPIAQPIKLKPAKKEFVSPEPVAEQNASEKV